jgi:hypothetical protein
MYPRTSQFMEVLSRIDPEGVFTSDLARRIGLKPRRVGGGPE